MLKLIGTVEKGQPVLVFVAGNLCSPEVFDQVKLPADMARLYVDYLGKEGPWDMDSLGWQLIDQLKKKCSGPIVLAGYSAGGVIAISAASKLRNCLQAWCYPIPVHAASVMGSLGLRMN